MQETPESNVLAHRPDFADPPVVETVLGVDFSPLPNWRVAHFGLFWERIKEAFPQVEPDQLALPSQLEEFERHARPAPPRLEFLEQPSVRCWFLDPVRSVLLQIQNGRFLENWRKETEATRYPNYETTRAGFGEDFERFIGFVAQNGLGEVSTRQCEISYVNHLKRGKEWDSWDDLGKALPQLGNISGRSLPSPEAFLWDVRYELPERRGRLYVQAQPAIRERDRAEVIVLVLTARGAPVSSQLEDVLRWFDAAHDWIHKGFRESVSPSMYKVWSGGRA